MAGCFLDVAERDARVESGGDEHMPPGVRTDSLVDPGPSGDTAHNPGSAVTIETATPTVAEARTAAVFTDGEIYSPCGSRGERDRDGLAALAVDDEDAVSSLEAELFDVSADRFRDAQPVQREERDQSVIAGSGQAGGDEHCPDLVAVKTSRVGLIVQAWPADVDRW